MINDMVNINNVTVVIMGIVRSSDITIPPPPPPGVARQHTYCLLFLQLEQPTGRPRAAQELLIVIA